MEIASSPFLTFDGRCYDQPQTFCYKKQKTLFESIKYILDIGSTLVQLFPHRQFERLQLIISGLRVQQKIIWHFYRALMEKNNEEKE